MIFRRKQVDASTENLITLGSLTSERILEGILPIFNKEYFENEYIAEIVKWALEYYGVYEKPPRETIFDIFDSKKGDFKEEVIETFNEILQNVSDLEGTTNEEYILDSALSYFKKKDLLIRANNITRLVERGATEEAENQIVNYKKVSKLVSGWENPFDDDKIVSTFRERTIEDFSFPGQMHSLVGYIERGWLVTFIGPRKRGKSFWLLESAWDGLTLGYKVIFISLEMKMKNIRERLYRRISSTGEIEGNYYYPCFDCLLNQTGECQRPERKNFEVIRTPADGLEPPGEKPPFDPGMIYEPCTYCRDNHESGFVPETWFTVAYRPKLTLSDTVRKSRAIKKMLGDNLRIKTYPKFSASVKDILRDLDGLEFSENFIPDIIVIDYADILAPEDGRITGRERINETWMSLGQMAEVRNCIVFTGTQANRASEKKLFLEQSDTAEAILKLDHVDLAIAINQTDEEKRIGHNRLSIIAHRHKEFHERDHCLILERRKLGQVHLDSQFIRSELVDDSF